MCAFTGRLLYLRTIYMFLGPTRSVSPEEDEAGWGGICAAGERGGVLILVRILSSWRDVFFCVCIFALRAATIPQREKGSCIKEH